MPADLSESTADPASLAIVSRGMCKSFGKVLAVDHLDLAIPRGRIFGFLGPNGSGKSTTIRMLCGLLTPTAGEITVLGYSIPEQAEALRLKVGYMTQKFSLYEDLSARENLQFMASVYSLSRQQRKERIAAAAERFELAHFLGQQAGTLSGGQKQRLALAAATLHRPELLFLDEPTSAVDPENRRAFWETLFDLVSEGTTILVSTHYMDEAERCHGLAILDKGELVASGSPAELSENMDARVAVVEAEQLRRAGKTLLQLPWVHSTAQIGNTLRVLYDRQSQQGGELIRSTLVENGVPVHQVQLVKPSLEDVFVAATQARKRQR